MIEQYKRFLRAVLLRCHIVWISPEHITYTDLSSGEETLFRTTEDVEYYFKVGNYERRYITVPTGYDTDFASIPKFFRWFISTIGGYNRISLLHDYLYFTKMYSRSEADFIFGSLTHEFGLSYAKSYLAWAALRIGGWYAWKYNKRRST